MIGKVVLLTNFIPPYRLPLYGELYRKLNTFTIFVSTYMEQNRPWIAEWNGLPVVVQRNITIPARWRHPFGFNEKNYIQIPWDTFYLLWKERPSVIISAEFGVRTLQAAIYRKMNARSRLLVWATVSDHTEKGRGFYRHILRDFILQHTDAVLVNGEAGARYIAKFGYPKKRIFFVPYTTDVKVFASCPILRITEEAYRLIYVGQLVERKGLMPFLRILHSWAIRHPERTIELWIVGDGYLRGLLAQMTHPMNLNVCMLGSKSYLDLPEIYAQCGILVFPSLADEWGVVVNEGMAAGLPVLGSLYSQAVEEMVEDGVNGWVFRPDVEKEMQLALDRALNTPLRELQEMRLKARRRSLEFAPDRVANMIIDAIEQVLTKGGG